MARLFEQAADLLDNSGWCKKTYARDPSREVVCPTSPSAIRFCALGALARILGSREEALLLAIGFHRFRMGLTEPAVAGQESTTLVWMANWNDRSPRRTVITRAFRTYGLWLRGRSE